MSDHIYGYYMNEVERLKLLSALKGYAVYTRARACFAADYYAKAAPDSEQSKSAAEKAYFAALAADAAEAYYIEFEARKRDV